MKRTTTKRKALDRLNIIDALDDPNLFGSFLRDRSTWHAWRAFLCALFGLPMSDTAAELFRACTGRVTVPIRAFNEAWLICGRRAGKSFTLAIIAVFLASFGKWQPHLGPGERAMILVIATDRKQARVIFRYVRGLLAVPMLAGLIDREASEVIDLTNGVSIEIAVASYRTTRGYTLAAVLADELAFWRTDDASEPDYAILDALRPGLGTLPGAMLLCASSPYAMSGALYDAYKRYHGRDDAPVLVWRAPTRTMNPTFPQAMIDRAMERDAPAASAEYLAQFRADIEKFVRAEAVSACTIAGRYELPPVAGTQYVGFVDPSGGAADAMTLAIGHRENDRVVLDLIREVKSPFNPDEVARQFCDTLKVYGLNVVVGDRVGGAWLVERFLVHGVRYEAAQKSKSDFYNELLPLINAGRAELLDHPLLVSQLCSLERVTRSGKIDVPKNSHDDICNAAAGALVLASGSVPSLWSASDFLGNDAKAVPPPKVVAAVFACAVPGQRGDGAVIFGALANGLDKLYLLDLNQGPLTPKLFADIGSRLTGMATTMHARSAAIFTTKSLSPQFERAGYLVAGEIDSLLAEGDALLGVSAAAHIAGGHVRICTEAYGKASASPLAILHGVIGDNDPMQTCTLAAIALALDTNRRLRAA